MASRFQALSHYSLVLFLLLVVPDACQAAAKTTLLKRKCEKYAAGTRHYYDFCMKTMQADRASATADARGLAAIAARIAATMAKATDDKILAALRDPATSPPRWRCLSACDTEYAVAARRLGLAAKVAAAAGKRARDVRELLSKAYGAPASCDTEFANAGQQGSPVSTADRRLDDVISMAISFLPLPPRGGVIDMLLGLNRYAELRIE
ncbi:hypothetical protein EJB05_13303, partial [Eragrostis curvula]